MKKNYKKNWAKGVFLAAAAFLWSVNLNAQVITQTLSYTGALQTLTVPNCVSQVTITCYGAQGANGANTASAAVGGTAGLGAMVTGVYPITGGTVLNVYVGGAGTGSVGGFNGGGNGGTGTISAGAGGGASDVRFGGITLTNRIMVAGGGGGGGNAGCASSTITGGTGGAGGGGNGTNGFNSQAGGGGQGGSGITGGAAGIGCPLASGTVGANGTSGVGGKGGNGPAICGAYVSGGGGGGGYFGGGGGGGGSAGTTSCTLNDQGGGGGGAGGTNFFNASITNTAVSNGVRTGNGVVVISYSVNSNPVISVNSGTICSGNSFTIVPSGATSYTIQGGLSIVSPTANATYTVIGANPGCVGVNTATSNVTVGICSPAAALDFDGSNDYVNAGNGITSSVNTLTKLTVEAWVRPTSLSGLGCIVGNYQTNNAGNLQLLLRRSGNSGYEFWVGNGGTWNQVLSSATPTLNIWQHVAGVWDGTVSKIYVNGVLSGTFATTIPNLNNPTNNVWIGANSIGENFTGNIDEVRIWNTARTQCEVNTFMNCEIPTSAIGLVANYHFNQGFDSNANPSITTLTDASGSVYTGTLTNFGLASSTSNWIAPGGVVSGFTTTLAPPTVGSTVSNSVICNGNSTTLSGTGASTYVWTGGVTNAVAFSPSVTAGYTVTGTAATGCTNTAVNSVTVNPTPTVSVNSGSICSGGSFTITPTGAATYTIQGGLAVVNPTATASFTVAGTNTLGCNSNVATSNVTVNPLPTVSAATSATLICTLPVQQSATLTASGASTYTWNTSATTTSIAISPSVTTTYTVNGTDANGCSNFAVVTQSVSACAGINNPALNTPNSTFNIYPNPFNNKITVTTDGLKQSVIIYNIMGSVIFNTVIDVEKTEIDLSKEQSGIYFIRIGNTTKKIIKE